MKAIIVGVSDINRRILENTFQSLDHPEPEFFGEPAAAVKAVADRRFSLAVVNKTLSNTTGMAFTRELRSVEDRRYTPVLLVGDQFTHEEIVEAIKAGVNQVLLMPLTIGELELKIRAARKLRS